MLYTEKLAASWLFPVTEKLGLNTDYLESMEFGEITPEDLREVPVHRVYTGSCVGIEEETMLLVRLQGLGILRVPLTPEYSYRSNWAYDEPEDREGNPLWDSLLAWAQARGKEYGMEPESLINRIKALIIIHSGYKVREHHSRPDWSVRILVRNFQEERLWDTLWNEADREVGKSMQEAYNEL
jgi:hypothetical protein